VPGESSAAATPAAIVAYGFILPVAGVRLSRRPGIVIEFMLDSALGRSFPSRSMVTAPPRRVLAFLDSRFCNNAAYCGSAGPDCRLVREVRRQAALRASRTLWRH
jgi:hypothetical protein